MSNDDTFDDFPLPPTPQPQPASGWNADKRGKRFPPTRGSWGMVDSNQRPHDPTLADKVLDESLG